MDDRITGTIKTINPTKGFAFIKRTDGEPDVFLHRSALKPRDWDHLAEGQGVEFGLEDRGKGPRAKDIVLG